MKRDHLMFATHLFAQYRWDRQLCTLKAISLNTHKASRQVRPSTISGSADYVSIAIAKWLLRLAPAEGSEPPTCWLLNSCSTNWAIRAKKGGRNTASIRMLRPVQNVNAYRFQSDGTRTVCYLSGLTYLWHRLTLLGAVRHCAITDTTFREREELDRTRTWQPRWLKS